MKAIAWIALIALPALLAAETDPNDPDAFAPATNIRKEIHSVYRYVPQAHPLPPTAPIFVAKAAEVPRQDFVDAAPLENGNSRTMRRLGVAIAQEKTDARNAMVAKNLGIGLWTKPIGGGWFAGAATAFYIPVFVGVGISW